MIATRDCRLTRMRWDGSINPDMMIHVSAIPFSIDLQHSRGKGPFTLNDCAGKTIWSRNSGVRTSSQLQDLFPNVFLQMKRYMTVKCYGRLKMPRQMAVHDTRQ